MQALYVISGMRSASKLSQHFSLRHACARLFGHSAVLVIADSFPPPTFFVVTVRIFTITGANSNETNFCQNDFMWKAEFLRKLSSLGVLSCHHRGKKIAGNVFEPLVRMNADR
jgi:hypothetical protein